MTEDKRVYPRIDSEWPLFLEKEGTRRQIGQVKDISLTGVHLLFTEGYVLNEDRAVVTLKLVNTQMAPSELIISGLKEWKDPSKNEVQVGLILSDMEKMTRSKLVRFLSRSDKLHVEAILLEI
jgi:c-di-GMP-binding flagellar brake protein YcgR